VTIRNMITLTTSGQVCLPHAAPRPVFARAVDELIPPASGNNYAEVVALAFA
jgi:hypothetical protein